MRGREFFTPSHVGDYTAHHPVSSETEKRELLLCHRSLRLMQQCYEKLRLITLRFADGGLIGVEVSAGGTGGGRGCGDGCGG
jgi:hypothetical protein